ncbi:MAG TPA: adenylate/guanylate cyclase domain-containing protein [Anaerolineae bacterium]|nr:adenylate/guanylate cyclase domain-containing protein [Anaerolineae bacterium]
MPDTQPPKSPSDLTLILKTPAAQADLKSLLAALNSALERQAVALTKMPSSGDVLQAQKALLEMQRILPKFQQAIDTLAREREALRALYEVGQTVNSTLELSEVLNQVMDHIIELTGAERGFLMLRSDATGELEFRVARNINRETLGSSAFQVSRTIVDQVATEGVAVVTTNAQADPRFATQESIVAYSLRSILCVPLRVRDRITGVVYADNRIKTGLFSDRDRDLLAAFANQAGLAIENARLFDSVKRNLAAITAMKNLMDNVFASIASGVITTDVADRITLFNRAAESIFGVAAGGILNQPYMAALSVARDLAPLINEVKSNETIVAQELTPILPERGAVSWRLSVAPLKDAAQITQGVAIVVDDLTEQRFIKDTFQRYVGPRVVQQLLSDPSRLKLGGERRTISVIYADIRGFSTFSERLRPEKLVEILNAYLGLAADAVLREEGTLDKFMGDAVMGFFNAPLDQADHTLRAVRAALSMQTAIAAYRERVPLGERLSYGVGINVGEAVVGNIGNAQQQNYTAIGDSVNYAKRLQENARHDQVLISQAVYDLVKPAVRVSSLEPLLVKGHSIPEPVYEVLGLK